MDMTRELNGDGRDDLRWFTATASRCWSRCRARGSLDSLTDVNGDGVASRPTLFSAIRVLVMSLLTGAGSFDLEFFRMEDGLYGERPNTVREIRPRAPRKAGESRGLRTNTSRPGTPRCTCGRIAVAAPEDEESPGSPTSTGTADRTS